MRKRKADRPQWFVIDDPIFQSSILVVIGGTINEAIAKYAEMIKVDPWTVDNSPQAHFCTYRPNSNGVIWLNTYSAQLLAHEAFHAAHSILAAVGLKLSDDSEEAYAYYIQWIVREVNRKCL